MKATVVITILILLALGMLGVIWYLYHKSRIQERQAIIALRTEQRQRKISQEIRSHGGQSERGSQKSQGKKRPPSKSQKQKPKKPKPAKKREEPGTQQQSDWGTPGGQSSSPPPGEDWSAFSNSNLQNDPPQDNSNTEQQPSNTSNDDGWANAPNGNQTEGNGGDSNNTPGGWQPSDAFSDSKKSEDKTEDESKKTQDARNDDSQW